MKRIERIYEYIKDKSGRYQLSQLKGRVGVDAKEIAEALDILRNNVSMELNVLFREGRIVKFSGRPVLYFDKDTLAEQCDEPIGDGPCEFERIEDCLGRSGRAARSPFDHLIGAERSLKKQVEQAKAAILYPPDGLHTLIVGQTGVGKTLFAHMMYEYGRSMHRFAEDAPFITFNCADYYNNPQLLISHVFGHIKGAFTGADAAKAGLVEAADGGVLFLDEIHRLPPEGQEMIFYFMDTGTFSRLGETERNRKAKVLIIAATTEDPDSALTKTFVRRIPNIITIRPLGERTLEEKIDIIKILLSEEAQRIHKPVRITFESVKALLGSIGAGNVGQLKSDIKLLCAKAFLNGIDNPEYIEIDFKMMPGNLKNGLLTLSADRKELAELAKYLDGPLLIAPTGEKIQPVASDESEQEAFDLYQVVEDKVELLKGEGISSELIKQIVATDVNIYIKSFYNKGAVYMTTRERLLKIVDKSLVDFSEQVVMHVQKRMNRGYRERFLYAFSLHLSAFLKRVKAKEPLAGAAEIEGAIPEDSLSFQVALEIQKMIEEHYHIKMPRMEVEYIALLLESSEDDEREEKVIILVTAHGRSTASSMVEVVQKLFSTDDTNLIAVDMPLEVKPQQTFEKMIRKIRECNYRKGVLLLADMGSLCNVGSMLMERLKVPVRTIDMVTTPLVLEAVRKADIIGMDLDSIYESMRNFKGYEVADFDNEDSPEAEEAIVTICSSGKGAAVKLKELVTEIIQHDVTSRPVEVIPIGTDGMDAKIQEIKQKYHVLATVGMTRPKGNLPFIPLDELIEGRGEKTLNSILHHDLNLVEQSNREVVVKKLCRESLEKFLTYLNPSKVLSVLLEFDDILEKELGESFSNPIKIRIIVHCGCALERAVLHGPLLYKGQKGDVDTQKLEAVKKAVSVFKNTLNIDLDEDECCYMADMV
jgi:transcriptional regulatory protein LevR/transcriptional regulator with AAA-type ATPase domain